MVVAGGFTDKLGTRKAFAIAIAIWSVAAMLPGAAFSVITFAIAMFLLGLGEAANFPACIKTVAEWFPERERALATGIFNSGANIGNIVVPIAVPTLVMLVTLARRFCRDRRTGMVWLVFWLIYYRRPEQHRSVSKAELELILSDPAEKRWKAFPGAACFRARRPGPSPSPSSSPTPSGGSILFWIPALSAVDLPPEPCSKAACRW